MSRPYTPPAFMESAYNCPYCDAYAKQLWYRVGDDKKSGAYSNYYVEEYMATNYCGHCGKQSFWYEEQMIIPNTFGVAMPNDDLDDDVKKDYLEAAGVASKSPRSAAALLRLAIQKLCKQLGEPGKNIDTDIKSLVAKGLPEKIQQALDTVRVVGNESVHPGEMNLEDDPETVSMLFQLINIIADYMISQQKQIAELYNKLPTSKLAAIQKRDNK